MKHLLICVVLFGVAATATCQPVSAPVASIHYRWVEPEASKTSPLLSANIFTGSAYDFSRMIMDACALRPSSTAANLRVPIGEEQLLMIKSGKLEIAFNDSTWSLGPGSIALLLPGQRFSVRAAGDEPCRFYRMSYRSREPVNLARGEEAGGSFVRNWDKLKFRAHSRGGVRSYFERPTAMSRRFEMHVTTLNPNLKSHDPHTHRAEEIILMLEDNGEGNAHTEMLIGEQSFRGKAGDLYYVGSNLLHGIKNIGTVPCSYFAFQFE